MDNTPRTRRMDNRRPARRVATSLPFTPPPPQ